MLSAHCNDPGDQVYYHNCITKDDDDDNGWGGGDDNIVFIFCINMHLY